MGLNFNEAVGQEARCDTVYFVQRNERGSNHWITVHELALPQLYWACTTSDIKKNITLTDVIDQYVKESCSTTLASKLLDVLCINFTIQRSIDGFEKVLVVTEHFTLYSVITPSRQTVKTTA